MSFFVLLIPLALSLAHYLGIHNAGALADKKGAVRSFAAGFSIGYVFLFLLPELPLLKNLVGVDTAILALLGFSLFHAAHKAVFKGHKWLKTEVTLDEIHLIVAAAYSFMLTYSLVEIALKNLWQGLILGMVIVLHIGLSEVIHTEAKGEVAQSIKIPLMIVFTLLGGVLPIAGLMSAKMNAVLFALTAGAIIYTAVREELPHDSDGEPALFLLGVMSLLVGKLMVQ